MSYDWIIYGNSVASLVLADELGKQNKSVVLVQPGRSWGGIFAGVEFDGIKYDVGMTNFEFELFGHDEPDLSKYNYDRRNDLVNFVSFVKHYVSQFVSFHQLSTPQMLSNGKMVGDIVITNQFDLLKELNVETQTKIRSELEEIVHKGSPYHPRNKIENPRLMAETSLEIASISNHGETFHNLVIEPMCQKIVGVSSREISSLYHRGSWVPLYYPETLLSQFTERPQMLKPTIFHYVDGSHFGLIVEKILEQVKGRSSVTIMTENVAQNLVFENGVLVKTDKNCFEGKNLAWCSDLNTLKKLVSPNSSFVFSEIASAQKADLDLYFLKVKKSGVSKQYSVLLDFESDSPFYRITNQSYCAESMEDFVQILLECNSKYLPENIEEAKRFVLPLLQKYGIDQRQVETINHLRAKGALTVPKKRVVEEVMTLRDEMLIQFKNLRLLGPGTGLWSNTFNDQVIQALKISNEKG